MRNTDDVVYEFNVVATESIGWRYSESSDFRSFIRIDGLLLCDGNCLWTGFLASEVGAQRKQNFDTITSTFLFFVRKQNSNIHRINVYAQIIYVHRKKKQENCCNSVLFVMATRHRGHTIAENVDDASKKWIIIVHG